MFVTQFGECGPHRAAAHCQTPLFLPGPAEAAGRPALNLMDVLLSLEDLGLSAQDLRQYAEAHDEVAFAHALSAYPLATQVLPLPSFAAKGEPPPAPHIPAYLPALPDAHTFAQTPDFKVPAPGTVSYAKPTVEMTVADVNKYVGCISHLFLCQCECEIHPGCDKQLFYEKLILNSVLAFCIIVACCGLDEFRTRIRTIYMSFLYNSYLLQS